VTAAPSSSYVCRRVRWTARTPRRHTYEEEGAAVTVAKAVADGTAAFVLTAADFPTAERLTAGEPLVWRGLLDSGVLPAARAAAADTVAEAIVADGFKAVHALW
jgi:hypothetical protein